jgi:hypothetical protein
MNRFYTGFLGQYYSVVGYSLLLLTLSSFIPVFGAKPVKPPIEDFYKDRYIIAEFKAQSQSDDGLVTLKKVADIWGRAKTTETLKFPRRETVSIQVGETYIAVFSYLRKHPLYRDVIEENPDGPTIVHGLAGAAIYRSDDALKYLFKAAEKSHSANEIDDPEQTIDAILALLLDEGKPRERRLASFQFMLSNQLHDQFNAKQAKAYQGLLKSQKLPNLEQELLLTAARGMPLAQRETWLVNLCRQTVDSAGVEYDLISLVPLKVRTCVRIIGDEVEAKDADRLTALLYSNAPGVSKAALRALVSWDEQKALEIFREVLDGNPAVHKETQRVLLTQIRQRENTL